MMTVSEWKTFRYLSVAKLNMKRDLQSGYMGPQHAQPIYKVHLWSNKGKAVKQNSHTCGYDHKQEFKRAISLNIASVISMFDLYP